MPGNKGRVGLILQPRDQKLLAALRILRVVDREQAERIAGYRSLRRANTRLLALSRSGFLRRSFIGAIGSGRRALYRLPGDRARLNPSFLEHQLLINRVYLRLRESSAEGVRLSSWRSFARPIAPSIPLIPDGYAELERSGQSYSIFLEVDRGTESSIVWREKARTYRSLALSGEFARIYGEEKFRVAVLAPSFRRVESMRRAVSEVTDKLFWFSIFEIIDRGSFFGSVWLRPTGEEKVPLL